MNFPRNTRDKARTGNRNPSSGGATPRPRTTPRRPPERERGHGGRDPAARYATPGEGRYAAQVAGTGGELGEGRRHRGKQSLVERPGSGGNEAIESMRQENTRWKYGTGKTSRRRAANHASLARSDSADNGGCGTSDRRAGCSHSGRRIPHGRPVPACDRQRWLARPWPRHAARRGLPDRRPRRYRTRRPARPTACRLRWREVPAGTLQPVRRDWAR